MNFRKLRETVREETIIEIFTRLVNATNQAAELLDPNAERGEDFFPNLQAVSRSLQSIQKRIAILNIDEDTWKNMSGEISSRIEGDRSKTWIEVRSLLIRELIPKVVASLNLVNSKKLPKEDIQVTAARERVSGLQSLVTGLAPSTGMQGEEPTSEEEPVPSENEPEVDK